MNLKLIWTSAYPNPHQGSFAIRIESAKNGVAVIEVWNASGQLVAQRTQNVTKGASNNVMFSNMSRGMLYYRVSIGNEISTGRVIGQ